LTPYIHVDTKEVEEPKLNKEVKGKKAKITKKPVEKKSEPKKEEKSAKKAPKQMDEIQKKTDAALNKYVSKNVHESIADEVQSTIDRLLANSMFVEPVVAEPAVIEEEPVVVPEPVVEIPEPVEEVAEVKSLQKGPLKSFWRSLKSAGIRDYMESPTVSSASRHPMFWYD
jgi:hypothetical protein